MNHKTSSELQQKLVITTNVNFVYLTSAPFTKLPSNLSYMPHQIPAPKSFSSRFVMVFVQFMDIMCNFENEDVGAAPTISEWQTDLLPTKVRLILEVLWYS